MNHVVADVELLQFFQREGHLAAPCLVAPQVVLMETVENLVVGEKAGFQVVVREPSMERLVHGREADARALLLEDGRQAVDLLGRIRQYI